MWGGCVCARARACVQKPVAWESCSRTGPFPNSALEDSGRVFTLSNLQAGLSHLQAEPIPGSTHPSASLACELPACPHDQGRGRMWGGVWPGSRSRPGAQAEARDRPRPASGARGERLEVPGVGSDKGRRPSSLAGWVPQSGGHGAHGGASFSTFPGGSPWAKCPGPRGALRRLTSMGLEARTGLSQAPREP